MRATVEEQAVELQLIKKRSLGLEGSLRGRHLPHEAKDELLAAIDEAVAAGSPYLRSAVYASKTKVAEIIRASGLGHPFTRSHKRTIIEPQDALSHEPWAIDLIWGMDWTWGNVHGRIMHLLVLLDWYSRKILAHGLFLQITSAEVAAVFTDVVALE